ncbi:mitochondrial fission factor isoform X5 [Sigmodon hispidus]
MLPDDRDNLSPARGFLSIIRSSTHRAYHRIMGVLDQNCRPSMGAMSVPKHDSIRHSTSSFDTAMEASSEEMTAVDAASLRRQIIKLNRRLQHLEEENKERAKREMVMYSVTVAFWLLNTWLWLRR